VTTEEEKAHNKKRRALRRAVVREAMAWYAAQKSAEPEALALLDARQARNTERLRKCLSETARRIDELLEETNVD
jgi:hypothetical protein